MNPSETIVIKCSELVAVATAMLQDQLNLIEGVRIICVLRYSVGDPENEVFKPIRGVESETDHFPLGKMRDHCAAGYLHRMDAEMIRYITNSKQDILSACKEIVRVFS